jgi:hypothetical protein
VTPLLGRAPIETRRVQRLGREQMCRLLKPADGVPVNPLPQPPEQQVLDREHEHTTAAREFYGLSLVSRLQFLAGRLKRDLEAGQHRKRSVWSGIAAADRTSSLNRATSGRRRPIRPSPGRPSLDPRATLCS